MLSNNRLTLTSELSVDLAEVAEALSSRLWEREADDDSESALLSQINRMLPSPTLRNELSGIVDRLDCIELHNQGNAMNWRPPTEPANALRHLLLKLFIPIELRWWLAVVPHGKQLVRSLPGKDATPQAIVTAAIAGLEHRGCIDARLFSSLIEERRRREPEIRSVAALWNVEIG